MRALLAACLSLGLAACATLRAPPVVTSTPAPVVATPNAVSEPLSRAVGRTPVVTPTAIPRAVATPTALVRAPVLNGLLDGVLPEDAGSDYALVLEDLASGARTAINADAALPSASLYKLGVAWAVMRQVDAGLLRQDAVLTIEDDDAVEPEPDGGFGVGDTPSVRDALAAMLSVSSNASAHALLRVLGRDAFTAEMDRIGLHQTRVPDDSLATTSAADIARLLRLIATSPELSAASRSVIAQAMGSIAPPDALRDTLPEGVGIFDKTGNLEDASNVGALLETPRATAILVVIDTGVDPGDARAIIAQAGQIAYHALLQ
ncbi:MAG: serine hydrolase [Chloroflexi bacterium]|nr:serine hydrolase [Chloroflexota bacterium]